MPAPSNHFIERRHLTGEAQLLFAREEGYRKLEFDGGLGRVIVIGLIRANEIVVGRETQLHSFDNIECDYFTSHCSVNLHGLDVSEDIKVTGHLGTYSCKAKSISAGGSITAAKNLEAVTLIHTDASINVGGHIICSEGDIIAPDGINCGNTITAKGSITTTNGLCAGACTWRRHKENDIISAGSINAGLILGRVDGKTVGGEPVSADAAATIVAFLEFMDKNGMVFTKDPNVN